MIIENNFIVQIKWKIISDLLSQGFKQATDQHSSSYDFLESYLPPYSYICLTSTSLEESDNSWTLEFLDVL
jgi:hypothetical protein